MTSVFEVPVKGMLQTEEMTKDTSQDEHDPQTREKDEPVSGRCFLICQTCFWCASYIDIIGNMEDLPYKACPTCYNRLESLPLSCDERYHFEYITTRTSCVGIS
ncbi:MAG: hypothetical protein WAM14_15005 [Candidatus Nitrosopolaris sp.]